MNLINGQIVGEEYARHFLSNIETVVDQTLQNKSLDIETVIGASDRLSKMLSAKDASALLDAMPIRPADASALMEQARYLLSRDYLEKKLDLELGRDPFAFHDIGGGKRVAMRPLGVLTHIAAGNAAGLPAISVLEGLMTGNINILKLPGFDDGLSTLLLKMLIDVEPRLSPYIYVFDLPSTDIDAIRKMLSVSDAAAVWGSDFAISGIRAVAPPGLRLIEWGHKLSFACVTRQGESKEALAGIAKDICQSEQLLCSSPQCVYFEAQSFEELVSFGERFADQMEAQCQLYPPFVLDQAVQAEITMQLSLTRCEELIDKVRLIQGSGFAVIIDDNPVLCAAPKFRTVYVKPMRGAAFFNMLRQQKGYLQTVGLACASGEYDDMSETLYRSGVCRVLPCGSMLSVGAGEPHDGLSALRQYVKAVVASPGD